MLRKRFQNQRSRSRRALAFDDLESRQVLSVSSVSLISGATLVVRADNAPTSVNVNSSGSNVQIREVSTSRTWSYPTSMVRIVEFDGGAGDDRFVNYISSLPIRAFGFGGNDYLEGYDAADYFNGGAGNDTLVGYGGNDTLEGAGGNDTLYGGRGNDWLDGGLNSSAVGPANTGNDRLYGEDGDDRLDASDVGNNYLNGGVGNDYLHGWGGNDTLEGAGGNDTLYGGAGSDALYGNSGNDYLDGSRDDSVDYLTGGSGADKFAYYPRDAFLDFNLSEGDRFA